MALMNKKILIILSVVILYVNLHSLETKKILTFTPLPIKKQSKLAEEFLPLYSYIEKKTGIKTKFVYENDYSTIIEKFKQNKIDIVLLGPLPYAKLNQTYKFNEPIITFKQKSGNPYYKCVLAKFGKDKINFDEKLKIALTQPLSTCGYYMTNILLKNKYNINLEEQSYDYIMSHSNVLIQVLEGNFNIAGVKDNIAHGFSSLGIRVIEQSKYLPGFSLIVNTKTVSPEEIKTIQNIILSIPQSSYQKWEGISSNGFVKANKELYKNIEIDFNKIPQTGNINEK